MINVMRINSSILTMNQYTAQFLTIYEDPIFENECDELMADDQIHKLLRFMLYLFI